MEPPSGRNRSGAFTSQAPLPRSYSCRSARLLVPPPLPIRCMHYWPTKILQVTGLQSWVDALQPLSSHSASRSKGTSYVSLSPDNRAYWTRNVLDRKIARAPAGNTVQEQDDRPAAAPQRWSLHHYSSILCIHRTLLYALVDTGSVPRTLRTSIPVHSYLVYSNYPTARWWWW